MTEIANALGILDKFLSVASELAKLPALVLPQYQSAALDLYQICQKLLTANENLSRWLYRFLYFDFRHQDARSNFLMTVQDYKVMKNGPEFRQLKFSCGDIGQIYYRNIQSKLGNWFTNQQKIEEVEGVFLALANIDNDMVAFVYDHVVARLDAFVRQAEQDVEMGNLNDSEEARLAFKAEFREVTERLENFSGELSDLIILFAGLARMPVTISTS